MSRQDKQVTAVKGSKVPAVADDPKKFSVLIKLARERCDELLQHDGMLKGYDGLVQEKADLRREIANNQQLVNNQKKEIEEKNNLLKKEKDEVEIIKRMVNNWSREHEKFEKRLAENDQEINKLKKDRDHRQETLIQSETANKELERKLKALNISDKNKDDELETLRIKVREENVRAAKAEKEWKNCFKELDALKKEIGMVPLQKEEIGCKFQKLADRLKDLIFQCFRRDTVAEPTTIRVPMGLEKVPQLKSNAPHAKLVRCMVVESVTAKLLQQHIFQPLLFPSIPNEIQPTAELVERFFKRFAEKKGGLPSIARCQITKMMDNHEVRKKAVEGMISGTLDILDTWLEDLSLRKRFGDTLGELSNEAFELWQNYVLKTDCTGIQAIVDIHRGQWFSEDEARDYGDTPSDQKHDVASESPLTPVAVLFPQICTDQGYLFPGRAVFHTQPVLVAAFADPNKQSAERAERLPPRRASHVASDHQRPLLPGGQGVKGPREGAVSKATGASKQEGPSASMNLAKIPASAKGK